MAPAIEVAASHPTRCRTYQAPDPAWAGRELLERVRQRLWQKDPRLNLWWNPHWKRDDHAQPGRWAVMYWMERGRIWSVVAYWEGAGGEFRPITPECIDEMLAWISSMEEEADVASRRIDMAEQIRVAKEEDDLARALDANFEDARERVFGVRQTFGPGGGRKRRSLARRMAESQLEAEKLAGEITADHQRRRAERAEEVRRRGRRS